MTGRLRIGLGGAFSIIGIAIWALGLTIFESKAQLAYAADVAGNPPDSEILDDQAQVLLWPNDIRWAAILLALAGLLLLVRGGPLAGAGTFLGWLAWMAADVGLDRAGIGGWAAAALAAAAVGAIFATVVRRGIRAGNARDGGGRYLVAYSGIAATVALLLLRVLPSYAYLRPSDMLTAATVLSICLVVASVALTLAAVPGDGNRRGVIALAVALVIGSVSAGLQAMSTTGAGVDARHLPWVVIPVLLIMCVVLVRGLPGPLGWLGHALLGLGGALSTAYLVLVGMIASGMLGHAVIPLTGDRTYFEAYHLTVAGLVGGLFLGLGTRFVAFWPGWHAALRPVRATTQASR